MNQKIGDMKNNYEKLRANLQKIKYEEIPSHQELYKANPEKFLQFLNYAFIEFSPAIYNDFLNKNYELFSKNDLRFMETIYQILLKEFNYKPVLNLSQFFSTSFYEVKLIFVNEAIELLLKKNMEYAPMKKKEKTNDLKSKPKEVKSLADNKESRILLPNKSAPIGEKSSNEIPLKAKKSPKVNVLVEKNFGNHENLLFSSFEHDIKQEEAFQEVNAEEVNPITQKIKPYEIERLSIEEIPEEEQESTPGSDKENDKNTLNVTKISQNPKSFGAFKDETIVKTDKKDKTKIRKKDLIQMIFQLNENQQMILKKFEDFQNTVNQWVANTNAQMFLIDNNMKLLKNQIEKHSEL